ncbi:riboflavin synthase subunit alpha [Paenibacillus swuensis]|uniref:Riboflavin synthase n=1 Tax=Paenibacillus swuensis TaxID=1178515 RepID=A0A172TML6_9BACL|nr:riboflavin synthase [Paenibacillus swuensis]ANE48013.1 riboflavin synthase subunit alpha [Paenibacillus swuensis]
MFTGLVEEMGHLKGISRKGEAMVISIGANKVLEKVALGDSIAVNGVCLTVTSFRSNEFSVDVMPETFKHTNLSLLASGSKVNLERAMKADGRFGGHIVQGHVDTYGTITERIHNANAVVFTIRPEDSDVFKYIIPRGSITVDGISLTVTTANQDTFAVSIIPHTLAETVLQDKRPGETVNIECDLLGKYVEHLLHFGRAKNMPVDRKAKAQSNLTTAFLADNGFL